MSTGYDGANRPSAVTGTLSTGQTSYASGVTYAPHGGTAGFAMENGVTPWFGYNNRLQVTTAQATVSANPSAYLFAEQPSWGTTNNNGNLQSATVWKGGPAPLNSLPKATQSYNYDTVNRLTAASDSSGWSRQFGYDAWGNMWVTANSGVNLAGNTPTANVYNSNNQMGGASYDAAGNLLLANGFTLGYDAENRQVSATEQPSLGGGQELYLYDGEGQRVEKIAPLGNTIYVYDAFGQLAAQYNTFGSTFACSTCYVTTDHLGSVRMVTDQNGSAVTRHDYLPFGEEIQGNSSSSEVEQRFTGQIRDTETGIDFFNARYFTAPLGRFNSADPESIGANLTDPQTWNGYGYVRNSPLALTDPSGQFLSSAAGAAAGGPVGAIIGGIFDILGALFGLFGGGGGPAAPPPPPPPPPPVSSSPGGATGLPSGSFPDGENLGLPPGMVIPGPFGIPSGTCDFGPCDAGSNSFAGGGGDPTTQIKSLYENILEHLEKIASNPNSPAVQHWRAEIESWIKQIMKKAGKRPGSVDKYLQRIIGITGSDLENLLPSPIIIVNPCFINPAAPYCNKGTYNGPV